MTCKTSRVWTRNSNPLEISSYRGEAQTRGKAEYTATLLRMRNQHFLIDPTKTAADTHTALISHADSISTFEEVPHHIKVSAWFHPDIQNLTDPYSNPSSMCKSFYYTYFFSDTVPPIMQQIVRQDYPFRIFAFEPSDAMSCLCYSSYPSTN